MIKCCGFITITAMLGFCLLVLFRLTFVMLLKSNSLLVPDSSVLLVHGGLKKNNRMQDGHVVSSGCHVWDKGQRMSLLLCCEVCACPAVLWGHYQWFRALAFGFFHVIDAVSFSAGLGIAPAASMPWAWLGWSSTSGVMSWHWKVWLSPMARAKGAARCLQGWKTFMSAFRKLLYLELTGKG